jgi:NAD-dependent deacetylase
MRIDLDDNSRLLVLTGAGISAESGVPTFRDINGFWEGNDVHRVASPDGFRDDPMLVWRFYSQRRAAMTGVVPNAGHLALAEVERRLGDRFLLATQNVDGLHRDAGSERMVEMHGNLMTSRCSRCDREPFRDTTAYKEGTVPACGVCQKAGREALLRPHIVWFGENLDGANVERIDRFMRDAREKLVFVAVGTSGVVYPAAGLVDDAKRLGGRTYLVNLEAPANATSFANVVLGPAAKQLPELFATMPA